MSLISLSRVTCSFNNLMLRGLQSSSTLCSTRHYLNRKLTRSSSSTGNSGAQSQSVPPASQFTVFYRFRYIRHARFMSRLKLYQTGLTVVAVPVSGYLYSVGAVGLEVCLQSAGLCSLAMAILYIAGNFFRRVVGLVALNPEETVVRISHLTFWGGRRDVYVSPEDIAPLADMKQSINDSFIDLIRYSAPKDVLYISLRFGTVEDEEMFFKVFGQLHQR